MNKAHLNRIREPARILLRWLYKAYRVVAISLGTLLILGWASLILREYSDRFILLPNGFQMVPVFYGSGGVLLLDRDGTAAVTSVEAITLCNEVIYGSRSETVQRHPVKSCGEEPNCEIYVRNMFIYDGKAETLQQYETFVSYVLRYGSAETSEGVFSEEQQVKFDAEVRKRNLPGFGFENAVDYSSIKHGEDVISKNELCRSGNRRTDD